MASWGFSLVSTNGSGVSGGVYFRQTITTPYGGRRSRNNNGASLQGVRISPVHGKRFDANLLRIRPAQVSSGHRHEFAGQGGTHVSMIRDVNPDLGPAEAAVGAGVALMSCDEWIVPETLPGGIETSLLDLP